MMDNAQADNGKPGYKLTVEWNISHGGYLYTLTQYLEFPNGERHVRKTVSGDRRWAERNANHFNIELPSEPKD